MKTRPIFAALVAAVALACPAHGVVTTSTTTVTCVASGGALTCALPFPFQNNSDLVVTLNGTLQTLTTHYSVSGAGAASGGSVTMVVNPPNGQSLVVTRLVPYTQPFNARAQGPFRPASYELAYDWIEYQVQQLATQYALATGPTGPAGPYSSPGTPVAVNLSGVSAAQGVATTLALSDHVHSISGTLPEARGGTGAGALTCAGGNVLTSNGTLYSCTNGLAITSTTAIGGAFTGAATFAGATAQGGAGAVGAAFTGGSSGIGVTGTGGSSGAGGSFTGGSGNTVGVVGQGTGSGAGVGGTGGGTNAVGVAGTGTGTAAGVTGQGGATGPGVIGTGGATSGEGVRGIGSGATATSSVYAGVHGAGSPGVFGEGWSNPFSGVAGATGVIGSGWSGAATLHVGNGGVGGSFGGGSCYALDAPCVGGIGVVATGGAGIISGGQGLQAQAGDSVVGAINLVPQTAPSGPANGDLWVTTNKLGARIGSATYSIAPLKAGTVALVSASPSTATVTMPTTGMNCTCTETTTSTNNGTLKCVVSGTTLTITGPNTVTDVISYICLVSQ